MPRMHKRAMNISASVEPATMYPYLYLYLAGMQIGDMITAAADTIGVFPIRGAYSPHHGWLFMHSRIQLPVGSWEPVPSPNCHSDNVSAMIYGQLIYHGPSNVTILWVNLRTADWTAIIPMCVWSVCVQQVARYFFLFFCLQGTW